MTVQELALRFACDHDWLIGVLHLPEPASPRGVLIVTGGPQYRIGSHRQFVLLARHLAAEGVAVMRFDYRGMGDSDGDARSFERVDADLHAAVQQFFRAAAGLKEVVLWGLCDGATAAAVHAARDQRIAGLVLLNPWIRTEQGLARATLRHYYVQRLLDPAFWRKLFGGKINPAASLGAIRQMALDSREPDPQHDTGHAGATLPQKLYAALVKFRRPVLLILSGADLGAREFAALATRHPHWRTLLAASNVTQAHIAQANHTFARQSWRDEVALRTASWVKSW